MTTLDLLQYGLLVLAAVFSVSIFVALWLSARDENRKARETRNADRPLYEVMNEELGPHRSEASRRERAAREVC